VYLYFVQIQATMFFTRVIPFFMKTFMLQFRFIGWKNDDFIYLFIKMWYACKKYRNTTQTYHIQHIKLMSF